MDVSYMLIISTYQIGVVTSSLPVHNIMLYIFICDEHDCHHHHHHHECTCAFLNYNFPSAIALFHLLHRQSSSSSFSPHHHHQHHCCNVIIILNTNCIIRLRKKRDGDDQLVEVVWWWRSWCMLDCNKRFIDIALDASCLRSEKMIQG